MAVTNILQQREIVGLKDALIGEKIKKRRGKALFDELRAVEEGKLLWLSPKKLQLARDLKTEREQAKLEKQRAKEERKVQRTVAQELKKQKATQRKVNQIA